MTATIVSRIVRTHTVHAMPRRAVVGSVFKEHGDVELGSVVVEYDGDGLARVREALSALRARKAEPEFAMYGETIELYFSHEPPMVGEADGSREQRFGVCSTATFQQGDGYRHFKQCYEKDGVVLVSIVGPGFTKEYPAEEFTVRHICRTPRVS